MRSINNSIKKIVILAILPLLISGCEEVLMEPSPENSYTKNFELLWETVDRKYSYFEEKNIDWDSVYQYYLPRVKQAKNTIEFFELMDEMMFELRDGHVNIRAGFDVSRNWKWYLDYPQNFDYSLIERNYLKNDYQITGPFKNRLIDGVGYVYYESFEDKVSDATMQYIITKYQQAKGLIIDVRNNGGGTLSNAYNILNHLTDKKRLVHYYHYKTGPGHDEFGDPVPKYIEPEGKEEYNKKIVVITNRSCYSATTFFVQMMKILPNVTVIGDITGGGGGLPINNELPNGWTYRFSSTQTTTTEGYQEDDGVKHIEFGVKPHIEVDITGSDIERGRDTILEYALNTF